MSVWYWAAVRPPTGMPLMPSQQSSLSPRRTTLVCQDAIAATEVSSDGPSNGPPHWTHAYSVPERFTPCGTTVFPLLSTRRFPMTESDGVPGGGVMVVVVVVGAVVVVVLAEVVVVVVGWVVVVAEVVVVVGKVLVVADVVVVVVGRPWWPTRCRVSPTAMAVGLLGSELEATAIPPANTARADAAAMTTVLPVRRI